MMTIWGASRVALAAYGQACWSLRPQGRAPHTLELWAPRSSAHCWTRGRQSFAQAFGAAAETARGAVGLDVKSSSDTIVAVVMRAAPVAYVPSLVVAEEVLLVKGWVADGGVPLLLPQTLQSMRLGPLR